VPLDGVHAHDEVAGDLAVGGSLKQQVQHLALGQLFHQGTVGSGGGREI
jgi:hypothetical protein